MKKPTHILVVDDDRRLRSLLSKFLIEQGYYVSTAKDVTEAEDALELFSVDLIVLDVMMPGKRGTDMAQELRAAKSITPILMLTAMGEVEDRIIGLESGADDYLGKPFEPRELILRVESILRRTQKNTLPQALSFTTPTFITLGNLTFDYAQGTLRDKDGVVPLTSAEAKLLSFLAERKGTSVSRSDLAAHMGEATRPVSERSIDVQITRIRQKIEEHPKRPMYLQTIWGEGYCLKNC